LEVPPPVVDLGQRVWLKIIFLYGIIVAQFVIHLRILGEGDMKLRALDPLLNPVEEDLIHNDSQFIQHFFEMITGFIQPPYAISIDGLWGTGKTTVMKILERRLKDSGYPVSWFNPWEYRQTDSVVLAFLQCLASGHKTLLKEMKKSGGKMLRVLLESGLDVGLKLITKNNLSLEEIKDGFDSTEKKQYALFEQYENTIETIKREFVELIERISLRHQNKPVVIFFDDLDRCLPDDSIQLLEAMKNLFVTEPCHAIFICGIDTRIAKQFISAHYSGIEETFAIDYFRKIFNLTVSMPFSSDIYKMLLTYIKQQYQWKDSGERNSEALAQMVAAAGLQAQIYSLRKYLNIIDNFNVFLQFNPGYRFNPEADFIVYLLLLKEAWQPLYEELIQSALRIRDANMEKLVYDLVAYGGKDGNRLSSFVKRRYLSDYLGTKSKFASEYLYQLLTRYPTLA
jgi:hypothetical protein